MTDGVQGRERAGQDRVRRGDQVGREDWEDWVDEAGLDENGSYIRISHQLP